MKRVCVMVVKVMVMVMMIVTVGCVKDSGRRDVELEVGERLPDFEVVMSDGRIVGDEDLRGRVSVVVFFHTTCPDCREVLPVLQRVYDEYGRNGVEFVLVSRDEGLEDIEAYWIENGLKMPFSAQNDRSVYEKFARTLIPRVYISDRDGIIRHIFTDNPVPGYDDLKSALDLLL